MFNNLYQSLKGFGGSLIPIMLIILSFVPLTIFITFLIWIHNISRNVYEIHDMFFELVKAKRKKEKKEAENQEQAENQQIDP